MKLHRRRMIRMLTLAVIVVSACVLGQGCTAKADPNPGRKLLYYQDSMHPWIKSDRPGKCTICQMDLTPIYEGEKGFGISDDIIAMSSNRITVLHVQTEEVKRRLLPRTLRVAGILEADSTRKAIISAPAPGRIDDVSVESAGVDVDKGHALATFYSPDLSFQTRQYIFRDRLPDRTNEFGSNPFPQVSTRHSLSHPTPARPRPEVDPFYHDLLSPLAGTVIERNVFDGQYVAEGDRLFTIVDCSVLWFRFDVYEQQLPWLEPGQNIDVTAMAVPGEEFPAVIAIIEPSLNEVTRTVKVRANVGNPLVGNPGQERRLLRLGMYAEGRIRSKLPNVLSVPRTAILFPGGSAYAYVDKGDGVYERRRVKLGRQGDELCEVLEGLGDGERVVTSGNVLIDAQAQFQRGAEAELAGVHEMVSAEMEHDRAGEEESLNDSEESASPKIASMKNISKLEAELTSFNPRHTRLETNNADQAFRNEMWRKRMATLGGRTNTMNKPSLTADQRQVLTDFLAVAARVSQALAADDLEQFNRHIASLPGVLPPLQKEFSRTHRLSELIQRLIALDQGKSAQDLNEARERFLPLSTATVELAQRLRKEDPAFAGLKIYHCPMAPKPGLWLQAKGPLANPFYGAKMLRCGKEVLE